MEPTVIIQEGGAGNGGPGGPVSSFGVAWPVIFFERKI